MQILQRMREMYASADFATSFLEAAIRKANIQVTPASRQAPPSKPDLPVIDLPRPNTLTPPPDTLTPSLSMPADNAGPYLFNPSTTTLPPSDESSTSSMHNFQNNDDENSMMQMNGSASLTNLMNFCNDEMLGKAIDFDSLIDFDADDLFAQGEGEKVGNSLELCLHGEGGGFTLESMDWSGQDLGMGAGVPGLDGVVGDLGQVCKPMDTMVGIDVDRMVLE
jgi:hypothetical protein